MNTMHSSAVSSYPESLFAAEEADDELFDAATDRYGDRNYRPFNRGAKLRDTVMQPRVVPSHQTIWGARKADELFEIGEVNMHPALALRKAEARDDIENPFHELNLSSYWYHPRAVSEFQDMPSAVHTIESPAMKELADIGMELIESDQPLRSTLGRLTRFLLGDDPLFRDVDLTTFLDSDTRREALELSQECLCYCDIFHDKMLEARTKLVNAHKRKESLKTNVLLFPPDMEDNVDNPSVV